MVSKTPQPRKEVILYLGKAGTHMSCRFFCCAIIFGCQDALYVKNQRLVKMISEPK